MKHFYFNTQGFILMLLLPFLLSGCYTLNTHQSAKTLGKGNISAQFIGGVAGSPSNTADPNNVDLVGSSMPQAQLAMGIADDMDVGVTIGLEKMGVLGKKQWLGDADSKFAIANGFYGFTSVENNFSLFEYSRLSGIELPIFLSYHPFKFATVYSNPVFSYYQVDRDLLDFSIIDFYNTGWYKGLSSGLMFDIGKPEWMFGARLSYEISWLAPLNGNEYIFFTTVGLGFTLKTNWFSGKRSGR